MKNFIGLLLISIISQTSYAQTIVEKQVPLGQAKNINFEFTRPELITIKTWSGNEVKLVASVEINKGENDDAFKFKIENSLGELTIASYIEDYEDIPRKIRIYKNGQEYVFNTDDTNSPEIQKFKEETGDDGYDYMNTGVIMDISIEIWVPEQASINVYSKFGLVEVVGFTRRMTINSKFGGIDLTTRGNEEIEVGTKFGEKYTNLPNKVVPISVGTRPGKWDSVKIIGSNSSIHQELKSEFGNIYIRKL
jgi:hypothetical protein